MKALCPLHGHPDEVGPAACHWCGRSRYAHRLGTFGRTWWAGFRNGWGLIKETAPVWIIVLAGAALIWTSSGGGSCGH